jgi:hypothetical protein
VDAIDFSPQSRLEKQWLICTDAASQNFEEILQDRFALSISAT